VANLSLSGNGPRVGESKQQRRTLRLVEGGQKTRSNYRQEPGD